ncbi:MAG: OB-fold domain-containing protein [Deltaproteobacteria bacterium]|nr:OB-fold domain-containing protein [Deltaproteobacteria bacterium]
MKTKVSAREGWFDANPERPRLIGSRCRSCRSYFFPQEAFACRNPSCGSSELEDVPLSATGTLWSYTDNHYQPPAPYVSPDPFVPYAIAAVELADEQMVVLGQVANGVATADLKVGMRMDLVAETLYADDATEYLVWKWTPAASSERADRSRP